MGNKALPKPTVPYVKSNFKLPLRVIATRAQQSGSLYLELKSLPGESTQDTEDVNAPGKRRIQTCGTPETCMLFVEGAHYSLTDLPLSDAKSSCKDPLVH